MLVILRLILMSAPMMFFTKGFSTNESFNSTALLDVNVTQVTEIGLPTSITQASNAKAFDVAEKL